MRKGIKGLRWLRSIQRLTPCHQRYYDCQTSLIIFFIIYLIIEKGADTITYPFTSPARRGAPYSPPLPPLSLPDPRPTHRALFAVLATAGVRRRSFRRWSFCI